MKLKLKASQPQTKMVYMGETIQMITQVSYAMFQLDMEVHDAQLDACTVGELEKALDFVARELLAKRARAIV